MADFGPDPRGATDAEHDGHVLIVGAGPTGLCLALALRRLGVDCTVIDAGEGPRVEPRAAVVWPREAELLAAIGLGDRLRAAALPLGATAVFRGRRRLGLLPSEGVASAFPRPLVIEQHVLQRLLEAELFDAGLQVQWRTHLVDFAAQDDGVVARLIRDDGSGGPFRASWLVGCDGARSLVRKRLGVPFLGRAVPDLEVVQVKANLDWPYDPALGALFLAGGRAMGAFPMPDGRRRFYCFKTIDEPARTSAPRLEEMQALISGMMGGAPVRLRDVDWLSRARFQERVAQRLRVGRALLAGDAAHVWPAVGGHGMAVAILGACNLGWRLAAVIRGQGPEALLDAYDHEQRAQARTMIGKMRMDLLERPLPAPAVMGLAALLPAVLGLAPVRRWIERGLLSDLGLHHRSSPCSASRAPGRLRAGDRLPDTLALVGGQARRLHDLIAFGNWTLLVGPNVDIDLITPRLAGRAPVRIVQIGSATAPHGASILLLVRPDGYVGLTARLDDPGALDAYLDAWLPVTAAYSREARVSWPVMNSSKAGVPASVSAMPRLMAGMMSSGRVTRSP